MSFNENNAVVHTEVITGSDGRQQVIHTHQDSASLMDALFDTVVDQRFQYNSIPWRKRNLPKSIFEQPTKSQPYSLYHHGHSKSTGLINTTYHQTPVSHTYHSSFDLTSSESHTASVKQTGNGASFNSSNNNNKSLPFYTTPIDLECEKEQALSHSPNFSYLKQKEKGQFYPKQFDHSRSRSLPANLQVPSVPLSRSQPSYEQSYANSNNYNMNVNDGNFHRSAGGKTSTHNPHRNQFHLSHGSIKHQLPHSQMIKSDVVTETRFNVEDYHSNIQTSSMMGQWNEPNQPSLDSPQMSQSSGGPQRSMLMSLMLEKEKLSKQINNQQSTQAGDLQVANAPTPPPPYHRRDPSYDGGLGISGLSLTAEEFSNRHPEMHVTNLLDRSNHVPEFPTASLVTYQSNNDATINNSCHFSPNVDPHGPSFFNKQYLDGAHQPHVGGNMVAGFQSTQPYAQQSLPHKTDVDDCDWLNAILP